MEGENYILYIYLYHSQWFSECCFQKGSGFFCNSEMDANVYELVYMIQVMFGFDAAQADQKEGKRRA